MDESTDKPTGTGETGGKTDLPLQQVKAAGKAVRKEGVEEAKKIGSETAKAAKQAVDKQAEEAAKSHPSTADTARKAGAKVKEISKGPKPLGKKILEGLGSAAKWVTPRIIPFALNFLSELWT